MDRMPFQGTDDFAHHEHQQQQSSQPSPRPSLLLTQLPWSTPFNHDEPAGSSSYIGGCLDMLSGAAASLEYNARRRGASSSSSRPGLKSASPMKSQAKRGPDDEVGLLSWFHAIS